jgi:hypothetical protein
MGSGSHTAFCLSHYEANEAHSRSGTGLPRATSSGEQGAGDSITEPRPTKGEGKRKERKRRRSEERMRVRWVRGQRAQRWRAGSATEGVPFLHVYPTIHPSLSSLTRSSRLFVMHYDFAVETRYHG